MEKAILRDNLFRKYLEYQTGVVASDLVTTLAFIPKVWKKLQKICADNIEYFGSHSTLEQCKIIQINQNDYLVLKFGLLDYVIIDLKRGQNVAKQLADNDSNYFLRKHFKELKINLDIAELGNVSTFNNPQALIDFYFQNQRVLNLSTSLEYRISIGEAWSYFFIDFVNSAAQLGFQTSDQFLYEQLLLNYDLTPFRMQDAQAKIGREKMNEMFSKIKSIKIPTEVIPPDLYEQYSLQKKLIKK